VTNVDWDRSCSAEYAWTERAYELRVSGELTVVLREYGGVRVCTATGSCPRCGHDVAFVLEQTALLPSGSARRSATRRLANPPTSAEGPIDIQCRCGQAHAGRPDAEWGCGLIFAVAGVSE
jgi:hypothetical protein